MTGTGIINKAADVWPLVRALAPEGLGKSKADFDARYKDGANLDELHLRLRSQVMVRRLKADVLKELPPKRRQVILLDVADATAILSAEHAALSGARTAHERLRAEVEALPHAEAVMRLRQGRLLALSEIAKVRKETAMAKLPACIDHIKAVLGETGKVVCFAHHHDVLDGLAEAFGRSAVTLDGRSNQDDRQAAVDRFQRDPSCKLFIGGLRAAGLGLTLTAASNVVFCELDWTPAMMMQAEDRCHRIGQHDSVLAQHLVIDGSIDAKMSQILIAKQAVMDAALDGGPRDAANADILEELWK